MHQVSIFVKFFLSHFFVTFQKQIYRLHKYAAGILVVMHYFIIVEVLRQPAQAKLFLSYLMNFKIIL